MAKVTAEELRKARVAWMKLCPALTDKVFEKFTGLSWWWATNAADTFISDECKNRIELLNSEHAYAIIQAWMAQQEPE